MRKTHTLADGTKLVTSSNRRYVLFTNTERFGYVIVRRSDNVSRLFGEFTPRTDVIVDFNAEGGSRTVEPRS